MARFLCWPEKVSHLVLCDFVLVLAVQLVCRAARRLALTEPLRLLGVWVGTAALFIDSRVEHSILYTVFKPRGGLEQLVCLEIPNRQPPTTHPPPATSILTWRLSAAQPRRSASLSGYRFPARCLAGVEEATGQQAKLYWAGRGLGAPGPASGPASGPAFARAPTAAELSRGTMQDATTNSTPGHPLSPSSHRVSACVMLFMLVLLLCSPLWPMFPATLRSPWQPSGGTRAPSTSGSKSRVVERFVCRTPILDEANRPAVRLWRDRVCSHPSSSRGCSAPLPRGGRKPLFVHIPKTGGESLEALLGTRKNHSLARNRPEIADGYKYHGHSGAESNRTRHFAFSIVRNPFDRFVSWFRFCLDGWYNPNRGVVETPQPRVLCRAAMRYWADFRSAPSSDTPDQRRQRSFSAWMRLVMSTTNSSVISGEHVFVPAFQLKNVQASQMAFLQPPPSARANRDPVVAVDFLVRFEDYDRDMRTLTCLLGEITAAFTRTLPSGPRGGSPRRTCAC